jgi:RNA polymerase sigma-70 factor (ECF subfamily)
VANVTALREKSEGGLRGEAVRPSGPGSGGGRSQRLAGFEELYAAQFHGLTLQINAYVGDLAEAQDLVQEAFCRAIPRWEKLATYDNPADWVRRVAWNLAISGWRRRRTAMAFLRRQRETHVEGPGPDRVALLRALGTLPDNQRRVFVLFYIAGLGVREIAEQVEVPEGTVKSWLHRARAAVAAQLTDRKETGDV